MKIFQAIKEQIMKFCGIISEFNPFHNGHKYIIEQAKKITGEEVVCLCSGDFVQRGLPAIQDKYTRAKNAIANGANAVLELPTFYATTNAENFAFGAIKILSSLGASHIAFGVKNASLELLTKIAKLKVENSERFQTAFKNEIENGINFNTALKRSIAKNLCDENVLEILNDPNNILAIEYLTAMIKTNSKMKPVAIERVDNGYFSNEPSQNFLSASGIRELVFNGQNFSNYVPKNAKIDNFFNKNHIKTLNCLQILKIKQSSPESLNTLYDYNEGIEYRIKKAVQEKESIDEIVDFIASPRYRKPRVNKLLLYPILNITKTAVALSKTTKPYAKVLAISKSNKDLLLTSKSKINLIVTNKDYELLNKKQNLLVDLDLNASMIYNTIFDNQKIDDMKKGTMFL